MTHDTYLTAPEAGHEVGVHPATISRWVKRGLLTAHVDRLDKRRRLISRAELRDLVDTHTPTA